MSPDDPVEEFFARERAQVRPLPADEGHWSSLVLEARREKRGRRMRYAMTAAAAVVIVGGGVTWALRPGTPDTDQSLPATATSQTTHPRTPTPSSASQTPARSTSPSTTSGSSRTHTPPQTTIAVPANFRVVSLSNVGGGTLYALGLTTCGSIGTPCPALARSTDDGSTWRLVSSFPENDVASEATGGAVGTDDSLREVRFASPQVGWVFGGALKMTTDGGRHWTDVKHSGRAVIDLETDGKTVVASTSDGDCTRLSCAGKVSVDVSSTAAWKPSTPATGLADGTVLSADVAYHQGAAFVSPIAERLATTPWRVVPSVAKIASTCEGEVPGPVSLVAPAAGDAIFAVCPSDGAAGTTGYHVAVSTDAGATWNPVSTDALTLVNAGTTSYAASDATHLVAVSGGSDALKGSMRVSSDGGRTWHTPAAPPPTPATGWSWVGAPGGRTLYAVPAGGASGFWVSSDNGEHWRQLRVAGG